MGYTKHILYNRARNSYYDQLKRCNNKKNPLYKWYGQKGVCVKYSLVEFLLWYYKNADGLSRPTIDRINHDGNYEFGNIRLIEKSENSKERIRRLGTPIPRRRVMMHKGEFRKHFDSAYSAARAIGGSNSKIHEVCSGKRKSHKGFFFIYLEA